LTEKVEFNTLRDRRDEICGPPLQTRLHVTDPASSQYIQCGVHMKAGALGS